jgi:hypothetical protein
MNIVISFTPKELKALREVLLIDDLEMEQDLMEIMKKTNNPLYRVFKKLKGERV